MQNEAFFPDALLPFRCLLACNKFFRTEADLLRHRAWCAVFQEEARAKLDGAAAKIAKNLERRRKRRKLEGHSTAVDNTVRLSLLCNGMFLYFTFQNQPAIYTAHEDLPPVTESGSPDTASDPPEGISPSVSNLSAHEPAPELLGRGRRVKRPTWKILEQLPQPQPPMSGPGDGSNEATRASYVWQGICTNIDSFGVFREYGEHPTFSPINHTSSSPVDSSNPPPPYWFPFPNASVYLLLDWVWRGPSSKSINEIDRLVHEVLLAPDFSLVDLEGFSTKSHTDRFDEYVSGNADGQISPSPSSDLPFEPDAGWKSASVSITVPDGREHLKRNDLPAPVFSVEGLMHRSIISVIRSVWSSKHALKFHLTPFQEYWRRDGSTVERIYGEMYSSDSFLKLHREIQELPGPEGCTLERVVCSLMFWSDATLLANFGTATLWPIYMFFGNESKYSRGEMGVDACQHIAYVPKVSLCTQ
jgi:hypothetical protein